ncbi:hypothetical protein [Halorussus amylolyticus]|uniref:hypothetical protein n=1 Tax=Halorussus amylolyticus TaxID=1126242 RepID=UPI00104CC7D2|nr:hypothetical protein [Halorussus amylolyticus]
MTGDAASLAHYLLRFVLVAVFLAGLVAAWAEFGISALLAVETVGIAVVLVVIWWAVSRLRRAREDGPDEANASDDRIEGSGEKIVRHVYNSQVGAGRETKRIREEADRISEADREARK